MLLLPCAAQDISDDELSRKDLARKILDNRDLPFVQDKAELRRALLVFFHFQGTDGNIIDGYIPAEKANVAYKYRLSQTMPNLRGHKNTVETDQESSLVQATHKYVSKTGDDSILSEEVNGISVHRRLAMALRYLMEHRYSKEYGLIWGATTVDWGDVQPEHSWGVELDDSSHRAIDIYDNAMFVIAIEAGMLSKTEILQVFNDMVNNKNFAGAASIGLTVYPTYPAGFFKNKSMKPFSYQNGGDWTWFGGRMIQQLIAYGYVEQAYRECLPMFERVRKNDGFFEWYTVENKPSGSGVFRGSAGVLGKAVQMFQQWSKEQLDENETS